jgi:hypothetical protein
MDCCRNCSLLNRALILGACSLSFIVLFFFLKEVLMDDLMSLPQWFQTLEREQELGQQLEEKRRTILENGRQVHEVLADLIHQRCDIHEAAARYRELCDPAQLQRIQSKYPRANTEEEQMISYLIYRVGKELKAHPSTCAEVVARLQMENTPLTAEDVLIRQPAAGP